MTLSNNMTMTLCTIYTHAYEPSAFLKLLKNDRFATFNTSLRISSNSRAVRVL